MLREAFQLLLPLAHKWRNIGVLLEIADRIMHDTYVYTCTYPSTYRVELKLRMLLFRLISKEQQTSVSSIWM